MATSESDSETIPKGTPAAEPRVVGRFRVDATLGAGGMGDVYRAYDTVLDRAVALKVLRSDGSADDSQRMRRVVREARAAAALTHPNTVTIFDVGEADHEVFIAMELLEGEDLRAVLERGDASLQDKLQWLLQAARALGAAHERGLVHRDVKPENMFVCKDGTLKLLDFGIAKRDDDDGFAGNVETNLGPSSLRTEVGRRLGTPRYMAPEQQASEPTDARTDEYAWGLVAFELLTGAHLGADLATVTRQGDDGSEPRALDPARLAALREKNPELSSATAAAITRALEPKKEDRFPSMAAIVEALEQGPEPAGSHPDVGEPREATDVPPPAPPPSPPRRAARSRGYAVAGIVIAAAASTTLVATRGWRSAGRSPATATSAAPVPIVMPPACRVVSRESVTVGDDDRLTVIPSGAVVVARDIKRGVSLQHETPAGKVPFKAGPMLQVMTQNLVDLSLAGATYDGQPAVVAHAWRSDGRGVTIGVFTEAGGAALRRLEGPQSGNALITSGDGLVIVGTSPSISGVAKPKPAAVHVYGVNIKQQADVLIEETHAMNPSIATSEDRTAVAYSALSAGGTPRFALLDAYLQRIGDVLTVTSSPAIPAVAFAGPTPGVLWMNDEGGKRRLVMASLPVGATAFTPPKVMADEALVDMAPMTARLPDGTWAVAWFAASAGLPTLRVSPLGANGVLTGPSDVAKDIPDRGRLWATATQDGIAFYWYGSSGKVDIARVLCDAPKPKP